MSRAGLLTIRSQWKFPSLYTQQAVQADVVRLVIHQMCPAILLLEHKANIFKGKGRSCVKLCYGPFPIYRVVTTQVVPLKGNILLR